MKINILLCFLLSCFSWVDNAYANAEGEVNLTDRGIRLLNQAEYQQAITVLQSESLKEDANAQFWLGVAQYKNRGGFEAGDTFLKAAELGDPWAMSLLSDENFFYSNVSCESNFWSCDNKWAKKASERWSELAEQGDPDAIYAVTVMGSRWWEFVPYYGYQHLLSRLERSIPNGGGYNFIGRYQLESDDLSNYLNYTVSRGDIDAIHVSTIMGNRWSEFISTLINIPWEFKFNYGYEYLLSRIEQSIPYRSHFIGRYQLESKDFLKYLIIAANQGDAPSMVNLSRNKHISDEDANKWAVQAIKLGYAKAALSLYYEYMNKGKERLITKSESKKDFFYKDSLIKMENRSAYYYSPSPPLTKDERKKAYFYGYIYFLLSGDRKEINPSLIRSSLYNKKGHTLYDKNKKRMYKVHITNTEERELQRQAEDFLKGVRANKFLTKNSSDLFSSVWDK